jgi:hypothetical protein
MVFDILNLIAAFTLHTAVFTLLVVKRNEKSSTIDLLKFNGENKNIAIVVDEEESHLGKELRKSNKYDFYPEIHDDDEVKWKNPRTFLNGIKPECEDENDDHFLEILDSHRVLNSEGVEILETIAEIDEEEKLADEISDQINFKIENMNDRTFDNSIPCHEKVSRTCRDFVTLLHRQMFNPLRRSFKIFKFYPSVILKSVDVFSYLLFITLILPNQVLRQLRFENVENVVYLITLMGFCWILYSIAMLKFHKALKQNFVHYFHLLGLLAKFLGYLCKCITKCFFRHKMKTGENYSKENFLFGDFISFFFPFK